MATPEMTTHEDPIANVNEVLEYLMWLNQVLQKDVIAATGIPSSNFIRARQGRRDWSLRELLALASFFNVALQMFVDGPQETQAELWRAFRQHRGTAARVRDLRTVGARPSVTDVMTQRHDGSATSGNHTVRRDVAGGRQLARIERKPGLARYGTHAAAA